MDCGQGHRSCLFAPPGYAGNYGTDLCWRQWRVNVLPLIELGSRAALALGLIR